MKYTKEQVLEALSVIEKTSATGLAGRLYNVAKASTKTLKDYGAKKITKEQAGETLRRGGQMAKADVAGAVRRNPIKAVSGVGAAGLGAGYLAGRNRN